MLRVVQTMLFNAENSKELKEKLGLDIGAGVQMSGSGVVATPSLCLPGAATLIDVCWGGCVIFEPPFNLNNVQIGSHVHLCRGLTLFNEPPSNWLAASPLFPGRQMPGVVVRKGPPTIIGADTWVGPGVMLKAGISIGQGCFIQAGSIISENVPDFSIVSGTKVSAKRLPEEIVTRAQKLRWFEYNWQNVPLDWAHPDKALDYIEQLIENGQAQRFISWQYEDTAKDQLVFSKISEQ